MLRLKLPYAASVRPWFDRIARETGAIWFHSGQPGRAGHRWEWCSAWPGERYQYLGDGQVLRRRGDDYDHLTVADFYTFLAGQSRSGGAPDLPFASGLAGHLDYDAGFELNDLTPARTPAQALASVDRYDWSLVLDHQQHQAWLLVHPDCTDQTRQQALALQQVDPHTASVEATPGPQLHWRSTMPADDYQRRFERLQQYILAGDIYQANLTRHWQAECPAELDDWSLYQALIDQVPAPYSVFHRAADHSLLSVSPERFLTINGRDMVTQPIKGTRPRGQDPASDRAQANELRHSTKDRAENLMIVDLLRNDLARNAEPGSVRVPELFELMSYSNVHHLVSTVTARLREDSSPLQALRDAFPGGSITGAPKRRAMEVIDELEAAPRGSYCGSAFWLSDDGVLDSNILIRSLVRRGGTLICAGGGGIVADSEVEAEYRESATKVRQLLEAVGHLED